jgi:endo-1,4-beta-xylanase
MLIGTAIMASHLDDPRHARLIAEQFNCITPGNEMKPDALQRVKGRFTFERADRIVAFAQAHGMEVIGHTLVWHNQAPKWLFEDESGNPLPREVALANMKDHITTVMRHYKGRVKGWDVVNEAIPDGPGDLRETPAQRAIGDDYVLKAFEFAHEADPDAELYYNDYNIERDYKRDRALRLVRRVRDAGLRIDGVGIQGHWLLESPDIAEIERGIKAYLDEGFNVMITELDIDPLPRRGGGGADLSAAEREGLDPYKNGLPDEMQQKLADRYREVFALLMRYPQVSRVTFWGTTDDNTWLNNFPVRGRTNHPLLWDRQYQPKPAFDAVYRVLQSARGDGM